MTIDDVLWFYYVELPIGAAVIMLFCGGGWFAVWCWSAMQKARAEKAMLELELELDDD